MSTAPQGTSGKLTAWKTTLSALMVREGFNVRFDFGDVEQLARSIADNGIERPLNVVRAADDESKFEVIDGHRRHAALQLARDKGWIDAHSFQVPIMITPRTMPMIEQMMMIARANDGKPLMPIEEATLYKRLVDKGVPMSDICRTCGHSEVYVRQHLDLLAADPAVTAALRKGEISKTLALNIATQAKHGRVDAKAVVEKATSSTAGKREASAAVDPYIAKQRAIKVRLDSIREQLAAKQAEVKAALRDEGLTRATLRDMQYYKLIKAIGEEAALKQLVSDNEVE